MSSVAEFVLPWLQEDFTDHRMPRGPRLLAIIPSILASLLSGTVLLVAPTQTERWFAWTMSPVNAVWFGGLVLGAILSMSSVLGADSWMRFREVMGPIALFEGLLGLGLLVLPQHRPAAGPVAQVMQTLVPVSTLGCALLVVGVLAWQGVRVRAGAVPSFEVPDQSLRGPRRAVIEGVGWALLAGGLGAVLFHQSMAERWPWRMTTQDLVVIAASACAIATSVILQARTRYRRQHRPLALTLLAQTGSLLVAIFLFRDEFGDPALLLPMIVFASTIIVVMSVAALLFTGVDAPAGSPWRPLASGDG